MGVTTKEMAGESIVNNRANHLLKPLRTLLEVEALRTAGDQELLQRFAQSRDEAAFRVLVEKDWTPS